MVLLNSNRLRFVIYLALFGGCSSPRYLSQDEMGDAGGANGALDASGDLASESHRDAAIDSRDASLDAANDVPSASDVLGPDVVDRDGLGDSSFDGPSDDGPTSDLSVADVLPSDAPLLDMQPDTSPDSAPPACDCVPPAPAGWVYVRVAEEDSRASCPTNYKAELPLGLSVIDTGCNVCSCGDVIDPKCGVQLKRYRTACMGDPFYDGPWDSDPFGAGCQGFTFEVSGTQWFQAAAVPTGGKCQCTAVPNPARFKTNVSACSPKEKPPTCSDGFCLPKVTDPFQDTVCVMRTVDIDTPCPPAFPDKRTYATGITDNRACIGCTGVAEGVKCSSSTMVPCSGGSDGNNPFDKCTEMKPSPTQGLAVRTKTPVASGGTCRLTVSAKTTGMATTSGTRVVCCR